MKSAAMMAAMVLAVMGGWATAAEPDRGTPGDWLALRTVAAGGGGELGTAAERPPRGDPDRFLFAPSEPGYLGGRGLITMEGVTGMFLNPTSGTLDEGTFTVQYCAAVLRRGGRTEVQHTAMGSYGLTDWLEVGGFGRINDLPDDGAIGGGGPLARVRVLKDRDWWPEVSVGGMLREGNRRVQKRTVFVAASKRVPIDEEGLLRAFRLHGGFRQIWQDSSVNETRGSIGYIGGEVELPWDLYVVGEVSNKGTVVQRTPFAIGMQWRPTQMLGLSLAGVQTGGEDRLSIYAGIGISFDF